MEKWSWRSSRSSSTPDWKSCELMSQQPQFYITVVPLRTITQTAQTTWLQSLLKQKVQFWHHQCWTSLFFFFQRVLVDLSRPEEALAVAERACTRAFIDLLLERQAGSAGLFNGTTMDLSPITIDQINTTVSKQHGVVLYFSIAAGFLYSWLLTPKNG